MIYPRFEKVLWAGTHELPVQQAVTRLLRPGDCFWDVGAHIGVYSLIASRLVGAGGAVHSFEPQPETRKRLLAGTERNGCSNIHAHEVAISGQRGRAVLHAGTAPMLWSLEEPHGDDALADAATITVECITLADAAEFAGVPTLVKIDVEGAEVEILASCIEWIATVRPSFIVEFHDVAAVDPVVAMFPSYLWERLTEHHWLLRPRDLTA